MLSLSTSPAYSIILFQTVPRKIVFPFEAKFPGPFCPIIELMSACIILFFGTFPFSLRGHGGGHFHFKFLAYSIHDEKLSVNQNTLYHLHCTSNMPCGSEYAMCFLFTILKHSIDWRTRKYLNQSEHFISLQHTSKLPVIMWAVKTLLTDRFGIFSLSIFG